MHTSHDADKSKEQLIAELTALRRRVAELETVALQQQQFYALLDAVPAFVYLQAQDYTVPFTNRRFREQFGDPNGGPCYETLHGRTEPCDDCPTFRAFETGEPQTREWSDQAGRTFLIYAHPIPVADGPDLVLEVGFDVTVQRHMETALRESEEKYHTLFETEPDAIFLLDEETANILEANRAAVHLYGYSRDELLTMQAMDLSAEPGQTEQSVKQATDVHIPLRYHRKKDGAIFPVEIAANHFELHGRRVNITTVRDITERKQVEDAWRESKLLLDATGRMARVGGWELDPETSQVRWTEETYRIHEVPLDYEPPLEEAINFFHPDDQERLSQAIRRALDEGESYDLELRFITAQGNHLWTRTICQPQIVDGQVVKLMGTFQDITERKRATEALQRERANLSALVENTDDRIWAVDTEYRLIIGNSCFLEGLESGIQQHIRVGESVLVEGLPAETLDEWRGYYDRALNGETFSVETETHFAQEPRYIDYRFNPIRTSQGEVMGVTISGRDVTVRRRIEEQVKTSLQEKKALLAEIHHRVKNNLQVVSALLDFQLEDLAEQERTPRVQRAFQESQNRIYTMARIHEHLYHSDDLAWVNMGNYLENLAQYLYQTCATHPVSISVEVDDIVLNINAASPCGLIINELVSNALVHAFPPERDQALDPAPAPENEQDEIRILLRPAGKSGDENELELVVGDNGRGLPPGLNWQDSASLGLGLRIVDMLAHQLQASVKVDTSAGTEFTFTFPAPRPSPPAKGMLK